jgi:hypothetical protein
VGVGKHLLLADVREENADAVAEVLRNVGYEVSVARVDTGSRQAVRTSYSVVFSSTGSGDGFTARLPAFETREFFARRGRGGVLGQRGARINTISPGIIMTPLAKDELTGPRADGYRHMIDGSLARRVGKPDEDRNPRRPLIGPDGGFINRKRRSDGWRRYGRLLVRRSHRSTHTARRLGQAGANTFTLLSGLFAVIEGTDD